MNPFNAETCHCGHQRCSAGRCHNERCMFANPCKERPIERDAIARRYPRLLRALQYVAILSQGEAACALRDLHDHPKYGGSEAVVHFGGPRRCVREAIRTRHTARRLGYFATVHACAKEAAR